MISEEFVRPRDSADDHETKTRSFPGLPPGVHHEAHLEDGWLQRWAHLEASDRGAVQSTATTLKCCAAETARLRQGWPIVL